MIDNTKEGQSIWAEKYSYFKEGFDHKELYNNYCLLITTYHYDSLKAPVKIKEYFDPSVIFQTIYFNNQKGEHYSRNYYWFFRCFFGFKNI